MLVFDYINDIIEILQKVPGAPGEQLPSGATKELFEKAEKCNGLLLPSDLKQWLMITNGPCVGPGGIFGIFTKRKSLDILEVLKIHQNFF